MNTLISDDDPEIRLAVLSNSSMNNELLEKAMRDSDRRIREAAEHFYKSAKYIKD